MQIHDQVILVPEHDECRYLHASANGNEKGDKELNCAFASGNTYNGSWTIQLYDDCNKELKVCHKRR